MTDQLMFDTWAGLLRPMFPAGAQFTFKPRRRQICIWWTDADELGREGRCVRVVTVAFTQLAWKTYRGARSARRAKADLNLIAQLQAGLGQVEGEEAAYDFAGGELRIEVASIDLFPPPSGAMQPSGPSLLAG